MRHLLATLALVSLAACDGAGPDLPPEPDPPGLTFTDLPDGYSLSGGFTVPGRSDAATGAAGPLMATANLASGPTAGAARLAPGSAYGCVLAAADRGAEGGYRYRSVWLHFDGAEPDGPAATFRSVWRAPSGAGAVRASVCRIPQTAEALAALGALLDVEVGRTDARANGAPGTGPSTRARLATPTGPNHNGYVCEEGFWWGDDEMTWCTNGLWNSTPVVVVEEAPGSGGSAEPNDDPWPTSDDNPTEGEPADCVSEGPGMPCLPGSGGGGGLVDPPDDPEECDTGDPVIDDIGDHVDPLWKASDASNPDPFSRLEQGGWITRDPQTGKHSIVPFPDSFPRTACSVTLLPGVLPPNTVGMFHTHPYSYGDSEDYVACKFESISKGPLGLLPESDRMALAEELAQSSPYQGKPSEGDIVELQRIRNQGVEMFGIIADKDGYARYDADTDPAAPRSSLASYGPCGYDPNA